MTDSLKEIHQLILEYLEDSLDPSHPLSPQFPPEVLKQKVFLQLEDHGMGEEKLAELVKIYLDFSVRTASPRFYNQLFGGFLLPSYAGEVVAAATNTSMYTYEVSPLATLIEKELVATMCRLAGFRGEEGIFGTGGANANLVAMMAARHRADPTLKSRGISGSSQLAAFVSSEAHYSFEKAADLLGIGLDNLIKVEVDERGRMIPSALDALIQKAMADGKKPFFVGATAGTTVLGAFDPIREIHAVCRRHSPLWLHVDGAWGASVLLSQRHRHRMDGCELADSLTWDPHKMMGVPLVCSVFLVNHTGFLKPLNDVSDAGTQYLFHGQDESDYDLGRYSLQCGRRVDSLKLWLAWKCFGNRGFEERIDHIFELAEYMEHLLLEADDFEMVCRRNSLNLCFRWVPDRSLDKESLDRLNVRLRRELLRRGKAAVNYSIIDQRPAFRLIVVNFALQRSHLDTLISDIRATGSELLEMSVAGDESN